MFLFIIAMLLGGTAVPAGAQDYMGQVDQALDEMERSSGAEDAVQPKEIREYLDEITFSQDPLSVVLQKIAQRTGLLIQIPEGAQETVTLHLEGVTVWDALRIILNIHDMAFVRDNALVKVMPAETFQKMYGYAFSGGLDAAVVPVRFTALNPLLAELEKMVSAGGAIFADRMNQQIVIMDVPEKVSRMKEFIRSQDVLLQTEIFTLEYADVEDIRSKIAAMASPDLGQVRYDRDAGTVVVTDLPEKIKDVAALIRSEDRKREVLVEARVIRIRLNEEHADGVDWEAIVSEYAAAELLLPDGQSRENGGLHFGTLNSEDFVVLLDALDAVGNVVHLQSPDIKLTAGREKTVVIDTNDPFCPKSPSANNGSDRPMLLDPEGFQMQLQMTAKMEGGDEVALSFLPRVHWMQSEQPEEQEDILTAGKRPEFTLKEGEVVVIGGLIRGEAISRTRKVPLLGDLPFVGGAFRRERRHEENTEYLVFLKAKSLDQK
ncbi:MAG: type II secretion system protein GspD [Candidatus Omnitrophota bacterium]